MIYKIDALIESDDKILRDIGHVLYSREGDGLTADELERVLDLLDQYVNDYGRLTKRDKEAFDLGYETGRADGYAKGKEAGRAELDVSTSHNLDMLKAITSKK